MTTGALTRKCARCRWTCSSVHTVFFYDLEGKYAKLQQLKANAPNPYIDRAGFFAHVDEVEQNVQGMLQQQQK